MWPLSPGFLGCDISATEGLKHWTTMCFDGQASVCKAVISRLLFKACTFTRGRGCGRAVALLGGRVGGLGKGENGMESSVLAWGPPRRSGCVPVTLRPISRAINLERGMPGALCSWLSHSWD